MQKEEITIIDVCIMNEPLASLFSKDLHQHLPLENHNGQPLVPVLTDASKHHESFVPLESVLSAFKVELHCYCRLSHIVRSA